MKSGFEIQKDDSFRQFSEPFLGIANVASFHLIQVSNFDKDSNLDTAVSKDRDSDLKIFKGN